LEAFDLIVVGSGFGGAMAALPAVRAGKRVLMIERGDRVPRGSDNWGRDGFFSLTSAYSTDTPYSITDRTGAKSAESLGIIECVGGSSVFYGGVALRLRERDFEPDPDLDGDSGASWPYTYEDLEPYYAEAEQLLGVAGRAGEDPTEPPRSGPYPHQPAPLAAVSRRMADVATASGLRPFSLPLAINYAASARAETCVACGTCDGFACAVRAKNDIATTMIPMLERAGMTLVSGTVVVKLGVEGRRVTDVFAVDRRTLEPRQWQAKAVVVAAGALATPHLLLASDLQRVNPAGGTIGRYLMRHCNAVIMGVFPTRPAPNGEFHKQVGIQDFYYGHPSIAEPHGKLGCIQQFATPQTAYMVRHATDWIEERYRGLRRSIALSVAPWFVPFGTPRITGFIVIAEDRPQAGNRVSLGTTINRFGMPSATITHEYAARDHAARNALASVADGILKKAGSIYNFRDDIKTFSHAVGTVRTGEDPVRSPLDGWGAFRGVDNLYVADGSVLPRSGGVNPSLTIAACALRTGERIAASL
jgi:choline dehydrogenase-like flavoprotein